MVLVVVVVVVVVVLVLVIVVVVADNYFLDVVHPVVCFVNYLLTTVHRVISGVCRFLLLRCGLVVYLFVAYLTKLSRNYTVYHIT